jgi:hypothetical protein
MLVKILKNLVGLGRGLAVNQITDIPDDVAAEWCRIGYASPASPPVVFEKANSKITPEVRDADNGIVSGGFSTQPRTSNTGRSKKSSKD